MKPLYTGSEWTIELLEEIWEQIDIIGKEFKLDYYTPSIEIITFNQMITNCSTSAMPTLFDHWSFGKDEMIAMRDYKKTGSGLAFEVVINTDPAIAYCMETNSATMQTLVMAHAICGHSSFFKNNYMFRQFTQADQILPYLERFKTYVVQCEERYGKLAVERLLDACLTLRLHSFDTCPKKKVSIEKQWAQMLQRIDYNESRDSEMDKALPADYDASLDVTAKDGLTVEDKQYIPNENVLKFIGKHSPKLHRWQRKIIEGFCDIQQYFYPQYLTKIMNEGWASFWHYTILETMHDRGLISNAAWLEVIDNHSAVLTQRDYSRLNPYALGFNIFMDIKRMSENPDEEDKKLFPQIAGHSWRDNIQWAMENYNDSSFIAQYLGPKVVKKMKLFHLRKDTENSMFVTYRVDATADEFDLDTIRSTLSKQQEMENFRPRITARVDKVDYVPTLSLGAPGTMEKGNLDTAVIHLWGTKYNIYYRLRGE